MKSIGNKILAAGLAAAMAVAPALAFAQVVPGIPDAQNPLKNIPLTGTTSTGQSFAGSFSIQRFQQVGNRLGAVGDLTFTQPGTSNTFTQSIAMPVNAVNGRSIPPGNGRGNGSNDREERGGFGARESKLDVTPATFHPGATGLAVTPVQATCPILDLVLGPLHLDLLGLVVDLNQVHLQITAQSGAGQLLGNLLCAVANLLNPPALGNLTNLLQQIVNILNGILAGL
jgi:hypothetical protein